MNHSYIAEFRNFRDEFRRFRESPFINHNPVAMDQEWLNNPAFFGGSGTREEASYTASTSLSSASQRATPISTPSSSDSKIAIAREEPNADEEAADGNDSEGLKEVEHQVTENGESLASGVKIPPQRSRKGHKKSRQGCYNCKRRKIKVRIPTRDNARDALLITCTCSVKRRSPNARTARGRISSAITLLQRRFRNCSCRRLILRALFPPLLFSRRRQHNSACWI